MHNHVASVLSHPNATPAPALHASGAVHRLQELGHLSEMQLQSKSGRADIILDVVDETFRVCEELKFLWNGTHDTPDSLALRLSVPVSPLFI